jgi:hypothetical protein
MREPKKEDLKLGDLYFVEWQDGDQTIFAYKRYVGSAYI